MVSLKIIDEKENENEFFLLKIKNKTNIKMKYSIDKLK